MAAAIAQRTAAWTLDPGLAKEAGAAVLAGAGVAGLALLVERGPRRPGPRARGVRGSGPARRLHAASAMLSASVLADSLVEHARGGFQNPGMYTPLLASTLSFAAGLDGATGGRAPRGSRKGAYALATAVGAVGVAFHAYNLLRRPGGLNWVNAFYAAPVGAPAALSLAGALGAVAERINAATDGRPHILGLPAGRILSALTGAGLVGAVGEAGLLHFRGAFQNPFMWLPVSLPPVAAALMGLAALGPVCGRPRPITRAWLGLTAVMGVAGVGFHAFGVSRAMGGWRNWRQTVVDGPPLPAPPAFSAPALAALAALDLLDGEHD